MRRGRWEIIPRPYDHVSEPRTPRRTPRFAPHEALTTVLRARPALPRLGMRPREHRNVSRPYPYRSCCLAHAPLRRCTSAGGQCRKQRLFCETETQRARMPQLQGRTVHTRHPHSNGRPRDITRLSRTARSCGCPPFTPAAKKGHIWLVFARRLGARRTRASAACCAVARRPLGNFLAVVKGQDRPRGGSHSCPHAHACGTCHLRRTDRDERHRPGPPEG